MTSRWIRLDVEWDESGWIDALDGQAAGCWPRLLCWVKLRGKKGQCKIPDRGTLARRWRVTRQAVVELMDAALQNGALRIDGELLIVVNWGEYQEPDSTASERKARQRERERQQKEGHGNVTGVTRDTPVTGRDRGVTRHVTPDRDKKEKPPYRGAKRKGPIPDGWEPNAAHSEIAETVGRDNLAMEATRFRDHALSNGRVQIDWDAAFRNWLRSEYGRPAADGTAGGVRSPRLHMTAEEVKEWAGE